MSDQKKLEDFIVNTDDVINLMELYATRIKSYPDNRAYYRALTIQCGEFLLQTRALGIPQIISVAQNLHQMIKLLSEKNLQASTAQMEMFIEEIQDLTAFLRKLFSNPKASRDYISANSTLLRNIIRTLSAEKARTQPEISTKDSLVDDPFDEMEGFEDFVDSFVDDLDSAFDSIVVAREPALESTPGTLALSDSEQTEVEKLFLNISGAYLQPVKDFMSELQSGAVSKQWIDICMSSLRIIEDAGTKMSLEKINQILERFKKLMLQAKTSGNQYINREIRLQLLKEYANLSTLLPEAFATSGSHATRGSVRDTIIINAILRKIPGVGPVSRNKLIAAGMNTLDKYYMASVKDLAVVSGITEHQAESICQAFAAYREAHQVAVDRSQQIQGSLTRLFRYLKDLKQVHDRYKDLTRLALYSNEHETERNQIRLSRQKTMWEINITLAELDAVNLIEDFRKMIFDRRIQRLDEYLQAEAAKYF